MSEWLPDLIRIAGAGQLCVLVASSLVPFRLDWKRELAGLPRLHRQMYWVYGGYVVLSIIAFGVISLMNADELAAGDTVPILVASAHALPTDTRRCETVSQTCPIDLFGALGDGGQLQQTPLLELIVRLVPGSNGEGPMLRDWTVRFSCPPSQ